MAHGPLVSKFSRLPDLKTSHPERKTEFQVSYVLQEFQFDYVVVKLHVNTCGRFVSFPREREKRDRRDSR